MIDIELVVRMVTINPFDFFHEEYAQTFPFVYEAGLEHQLAPYRVIEENTPLLDHWLKGIDGMMGSKTNDFLVEVNQRLWKEINYTVRMETGVQKVEDTLKKKTGSCRDSAWLLVQIMRKLGLAARFVSGYLIEAYGR